MRELETGLTTEQVAAHVCLSTRQLARKFQEAFGVSPAQYIDQARVELARGLLSGTQQPLEKIALRCGFSGRQQMARVFTKAMDVSPSAFRARFNPTTMDLSPKP